MELINTSLFWDANLVYYYPMWHSVIEVASPTPYGQTFTKMATVNLVAGKYNNCASATWNTTNYLWTSASYNFTTGNLTLCCWVKIATPPTNNFTPTILSIGGGSPRGYLIAAKTTGYAGFYTFDGASTNCDSTTNICDDKWHHVAGVRNGTTLLVYVDGAQVGSTTGTVRNLNTATFYVGTHGDPAYDNLGAAYIDEIAGFSRVLSTAEIYSLAKSPTVNGIKQYRRTRTPGPVAGI